MERGESSEERTDVKEESAATMLDSGAWKAGDKLGIIEGVRTRTEGLGTVGESPRFKFEVRSGRNVCMVRMGFRRRVFMRSLSVEGERVAIGEEG
jgi:hypothetical protein